MKKLFFLFLLVGVLNPISAATISDVSAQNRDFCLVVWQRSGPLATYRLRTHPRIKYKDNKFWIISDDVEIAYPIFEVCKFTLNDNAEDFEDGIESLSDSEENNRSFALEKVRPGSTICIYEINGRNLGTYIVETDGQLKYSLKNYPAGVYLIKTETTTIKIIKK